MKTQKSSIKSSFCKDSHFEAYPYDIGSKRTNHKFGCFGEARQSNILISSKIPENVYFLIFIFIFFKK